MSASTDPGRSTGPPPAEPEGSKPKLVESIVIASELWLLVIIAHIVTVVATFGTTRDTYLKMAKDSYRPGTAEYDTITSTGVMVGLVVATTVIEIAVAVVLLVLTRKGYNWARFILGAVSLYLVITTLFSIFGDVHPRWAMIPNVIGGVAALGAVVLLLRRDSDTYCKKMAAYRHAPRTPTAPPYPPTPGYGPPPPGQYSGQYPGSQYPSPYGQYPPPGQYPPGYPTPGQYPPYDDPSRPAADPPPDDSSQHDKGQQPRDDPQA
ncbi:hypothetical protein ACPXB3_12825 [Gordonia sp. DT219]|uniref:hypothetical protein n=1 Tax=Gordonia sp. DT219 TaxID=3416658 RepID=UPI003CEF03CA